MARCPECNRFVSLEIADEPEVDVSLTSLDTISITGRLVRLCAECGEEMQEAQLDFDVAIDPGAFDPPRPDWVT